MGAGDISGSVCAGVARVLASAWLVLAAAGCACEETFAFLRDRCYEFRSVAEAQRTVLFTICVPEYVPEGVRPEPRVVGMVDGDNPDYPWIQLLYYDTDGDMLMIDLGEQYDPAIALYRLELSESYARRATYSLVRWLVMGWRAPASLREWRKKNDRVQALSKQARSEVTAVAGRDGQEYLVCELVDPADLHGTLVEWRRGLRFCQLHSRLSPEEALRVAESLPYCGLNTEPTVTPAATCAP